MGVTDNGLRHNELTNSAAAIITISIKNVPKTFTSGQNNVRGTQKREASGCWRRREVIEVVTTWNFNGAERGGDY